jgi:hypothetical protein
MGRLFRVSQKSTALQHATDRAGSNHYGSDRFETGQVRARRMIREQLKHLGWAESELKAN